MYAKSKFGLSTDDLRQITGYRSAHKHYGGGNNRTLYRERDLVRIIDRRAGKTVATPEAVEERRLQFRKQQEDEAQASRDRDLDSIVPAERLGNLQLNRLTAMVRFYEAGGQAVGAAAAADKKILVERIVKAGYTVEKETARQDAIRAAEHAALQRRAAAQEIERRKQQAHRARWVKERQELAKQKAAKLASVVAGQASWADLNVIQLKEQCRKRRLIYTGLNKAEVVARIERYESETPEERRASARLAIQQDFARKAAVKAKKEENEARKRATYERERLAREAQRALQAEREQKKREEKAKQIAAKLAKIAAGTGSWADLLSAELKEECLKRRLIHAGLKKGELVARIERYESETPEQRRATALVALEQDKARKAAAKAKQQAKKQARYASLSGLPAWKKGRT